MLQIGNKIVCRCKLLNLAKGKQSGLQLSTFYTACHQGISFAKFDISAGKMNKVVTVNGFGQDFNYMMIKILTTSNDSYFVVD